MIETKSKVLLVTGEGGLGDRSFNDAGFAGARRAIKELGLGVDLVELNEIGDLAEDTYISAATKNEYCLIVALGFYQGAIVDSVARIFSDQKFVLIDAESSEPNVKAILFREEENAFLAGMLAAYVCQNKDKKIGIVLGMDAPHLTRYAFSYEAGAKTVDANTNVLVDIVGSFINRDKGKELALSQIDRGAEVIFQVAGASGLGVFDAVSEKGKYAIGEGMNQNHLHPEFIVASTYKHMDSAVFDAIKSAASGEFVGGQESCGFKEGALVISMEGSEVTLPEKVKEHLATYQQKFVSGELKAPVNQEELDGYLN